MAPALLLVSLGLVLLTAGADRLVLFAARLSRRIGISPLLVGALVIGVGTSTPELVVGVVAAAEGSLDLAVGNLVGSNVANLTLVVGAAALIGPLVTRVETIRREGFLMLSGTVLFVLLAWDGHLGTRDGLLLLVAMVTASWMIVRWSASDRQGAAVMDQELSGIETGGRSTGRELATAALAVGATLAGAEFLVRGARSIALLAGLSDAVVGLTVVATGTSLPELATAVAAARRGEGDLVLGNIVGSNLFNVLLVGGAAALAGADDLTGGFQTPFGVMLGATVAVGLLATTGRRVVRWEGLALLTVFAGLVVGVL